MFLKKPKKVLVPKIGTILFFAHLGFTTETMGCIK